MDVHQVSVSIAVRDATGKLVVESNSSDRLEIIRITRKPTKRHIGVSLSGIAQFEQLASAE
jgi:hypothetical protein